jgi:hypothetical protein
MTSSRGWPPPGDARTAAMCRLAADIPTPVQADLPAMSTATTTAATR